MSSGQQVTSLKLVRDQDVRRVLVKDSLDLYAQAVGLAAEAFGLERFALKYRDDEDELVTVASEEELQEAARLSARNGCLKLFLVAAATDRVSDAAVEAAGQDDDVDSDGFVPVHPDTRETDQQQDGTHEAQASSNDTNNNTGRGPAGDKQLVPDAAASTAAGPKKPDAEPVIEDGNDDDNSDDDDSDDVSDDEDDDNDEEGAKDAPDGGPCHAPLPLSLWIGHLRALGVAPELIEDFTQQPGFLASIEAAVRQGLEQRVQPVELINAALDSHPDIRQHQLVVQATPLVMPLVSLLDPVLVYGACGAEAAVVAASAGQTEVGQQASGADAGAGTHPNVACDGCGAHPIVGPRFKCTVCDNYDLCEACEETSAAGSHDPAHPMLKIKQAERPREAVHAGITCDGCGASPVRGVRYKCAECHDYDLCKACEGAGVATLSHAPEHSMVKMREPAGRRGCGRRGGGPRAGHGHGHGHGHHLHQRGWGGRGRGGGRGGFLRKFLFGGGGGRRCGGGGRGAEQAKAKAERKAEQAERKAERQAERKAAGKDKDRRPRARAAFVSDVTIPDNSVCPPGTTLSKVWRMRNTGKVPWPAHTRLVCVGGDASLKAQDDEASTQAVSVIGGLMPGETVDVQRALRTPSEAGAYQATYRLQDPETGHCFGHRVWIRLSVVDQAVPHGVALAAALAQADADATEVELKQPEPEQEPVAAAASASAAEPQPEAEASAPPAPSDGVDEAVASAALATLRRMGFHDDDVNTFALRQHNYDVRATIDWLLNQMQ